MGKRCAKGEANGSLACRGGLRESAQLHLHGHQRQQQARHLLRGAKIPILPWSAH